MSDRNVRIIGIVLGHQAPFFIAAMRFDLLLGEESKGVSGIGGS